MGRVACYEVRCPLCGGITGQGFRPVRAGVECAACFRKAIEPLRQQAASPDARRRMRRYAPELGQLAFGNRWSELELPADLASYAAQELYALLDRVGHGYVYEATGPDMELRSYVWEDCRCQGDRPDPACRACKPNFRLADLEFRWYKHPGRGLTVNRPTTREELERIFDRARLLVAFGLVQLRDG